MEETNKATATRDLQNVHPSYRLDGKNLSKMVSICPHFFKGKRKVEPYSWDKIKI